jgi:hypothetical protein
VLLLIPFILLIYMLLFNMGYNADRHRKVQAALRLGAFQYVSGLTTMNRVQAASSAVSIVQAEVFRNESNTVRLDFSGSAHQQPQCSDNPPDPPCFDDDQGFLGNVSSRITVRAAVKRTAPYANIFPNSDLRGSYIVSSNTWTYCEMNDEEFDGPGMGAIRTGAAIGKGVLWLFGGCGGDTFDLCGTDECSG